MQGGGRSPLSADNKKRYDEPVQKTILFLLAIVFCFSGCGAEQDGTTTGSATPETASAEIKKPSYRLKLPSSWREVPLSELPETLLVNSPAAVFQAGNADNGIFPNLAVTTDPLPNSWSALEFARQTVQNESVSLIGFQKFSEQEVDLGGQTTLLVEFEARAGAADQPLRFLQTFLNSQGQGLVFTAAVSPQATQASKETVLSILNSIAVNP